MKKMRASVKPGTKNNESKAGKSSPDINGFRALRSLFTDQLKDIYWAEKALVKAIPKLIKNSSSDALVQALTEHLSATMEHVERLEEVFAALEEKAVAVKCDAMQGLISEAQDIISETEKGMMRDAGIIAAAQKVEHYEIATYGTLSSLARNLGEETAAALLYDTLQEEKDADEKLTGIAEDLMQEELAHFEDKTDEDDEQPVKSVKSKKSKTLKKA